jgi:hypothetical protein
MVFITDGRIVKAIICCGVGVQLMIPAAIRPRAMLKSCVLTPIVTTGT